MSMEYLGFATQFFTLLDVSRASVTHYGRPGTRRVRPNFRLYLNGKMTWTEDGRAEEYEHFDADDIIDSLKFWRACLRRARKYWAMNVDTLDAIQNGEREDINDE